MPTKAQVDRYNKLVAGYDEREGKFKAISASEFRILEENMRLFLRQVVERPADDNKDDTKLTACLDELERAIAAFDKAVSAPSLPKRPTTGALPSSGAAAAVVVETPKILDAIPAYKAFCERRRGEEERRWYKEQSDSLRVTPGQPIKLPFKTPVDMAEFVEKNKATLQNFNIVQGGKVIAEYRGGNITSGSENMTPFINAHKERERAAAAAVRSQHPAGTTFADMSSGRVGHSGDRALSPPPDGTAPDGTALGGSAPGARGS